MTDAEFIAAAANRLEHLDSFGVRFVYLHRDDDQPPFGVLITASAYAQLLDLTPTSDDLMRLIAAHDHLIG